jgi:hypothetical protein
MLPATTLSLLLFFAGHASAADRFVAVTGTDAGACATPAAACATIGYAVTQALTGDTVKVGAGIYPGTLLFDSSITLVISGAWDTGFTLQDPTLHATQIRGVPGSPIPGLRFSDVITVTAGSGDTIDLTLDGLTIGRGTRGIFAVASADAVLDLSVMRSIVRQQQSGAIVVEANGTSAVGVSVTGSVVSRNVVGPALALDGAGLRVDARSTNPLTLSLTDSTIQTNRVRGSGASGGGAALVADSGSTLTTFIDGCTFSGNRAGRAVGGAIFGYAAPGGQLDVSISDSLVTGNSAFSGGGMLL